LHLNKKEKCNRPNKCKRLNSNRPNKFQRPIKKKMKKKTYLKNGWWQVKMVSNLKVVVGINCLKLMKKWCNQKKIQVLIILILLELTKLIKRLLECKLQDNQINLNSDRCPILVIKKVLWDKDLFQCSNK